MAGPLRIDPERFVSFDSHRFTLFVNALLRAEATAIGIPQVKVDTTIADTVPDGGVDARITNTVTKPNSTDWIPENVSAWQFKSGSCSSANVIANTELTKPEVTRAITNGESYCFVTADSITATKKQEIQEAIDARYQDLGQPATGRIITADQLAEWGVRWMAVAVQFALLQIPAWQTFSQWSSLRRFRNPYFADPARSSLINELQTGIASGTKLFRILGLAGVGKTRVVLEALRQPGLSDISLYLADAGDFDSQFVWYLQQQNQDGRGIFVIDECTSDSYGRIEDIVDHLPAGYSVIAIGPREFRSTSGTMELGPLAIEQLTQVLQNYVPALSEPHCRAIAERCGGSPKLIVTIATGIGQNASSQWADIEQNHDVVEYINRKLFPLNSTDIQSRLMRAVSLFVRIGWREDRVAEGEALCDAFGINWMEAQRAVGQLEKQGIISKRGRYIYPTPDILANYLCRETLHDFGASNLRQLLIDIPSDALNAFVERMRQLGETAETEEVLTSFLEDPNFFRSVEDLNREPIAHLARLLAPLSPDRMLVRLDSVLSPASQEQLQGLKQGRREIVWLLEELAWWQEHFLVASQLLLKLACAENEQYANNATGIWQRLFQGNLSGTSAPFDIRLPILRRSLASEDPEERRMGVLALRSLLKLRNLHRFGSPPSRTGELPPTEWQPSSRREWLSLLVEGLQLLKTALQDSHEAVSSEAVGVLAQSGYELLKTGLAKEWCDAALVVADFPFERRLSVLKTVDQSLPNMHDATDEERASLNSLAEVLSGASFSERLRRATEPWFFENERRGNETNRSVFTDLAEEILIEPNLLSSDLSWFTGGHANSAFEFGQVLGAADSNLHLLNLITEGYTGESFDDRLVCGYVAGALEHHNFDWLDTLLDEWVSNPDRALVAASLIALHDKTDKSAHRLEEMIKNKVIPASFVGRLVSGFWTRSISPEVLRELLDTVLADAEPYAISGILAVLYQYLDEYPDRLLFFQGTLIQALTITTDLSVTAMDSYYWKNLADLLVEYEPLKLAHYCIDAAKDYENLTVTDDLREVLLKTIHFGGWQIFEEVLGPALLEDTMSFWVIDDPLEGRVLLEQFAPEDLLEWISADPENRLHLVAHTVPVYGQPLNEIARSLLINWGEADEVRSALAATFGTGSWIGNESAWLEQKLETARRWAQDPDLNVRQWANELIETYSRRLQRARILEEE